MSLTTTAVTPALFDYIVAHSTASDAVETELIARTRALGDPAGMQISPDEGAFLTLLARLTGARNALEIGTFTGYSALCLTRGMGPEGRLVCCDVSDEWTSIARQFWQRAGVDGQIDLRLGAGLDSVRAMAAEPTFDLAFIDADKPTYPDYWAEVVPRVRSGGVILVDNAFNHGAVADPAADNPSVRGIRAINDLARSDDRVDAALLTISDGILLALKR